jgi:hypothetical protein
MRLDEITELTTDPAMAFTKIKDAITSKGYSRSDCHGTCAKAIRDGLVDDSDIVVVLGPKASRSPMGVHSVIITKDGTLKVDKFVDDLADYDRETGVFTYKSGPQDFRVQVPVAYRKVGTIKQEVGIT